MRVCGHTLREKPFVMSSRAAVTLTVVVIAIAAVLAFTFGLRKDGDVEGQSGATPGGALSNRGSAPSLESGPASAPEIGVSTRETTARRLIVRGSVLGPVADALGDLRVALSLTDASGPVSSSTTVSINGETARYEYRDSDRLLSALLRGNALRIALEESRQELRSITLAATEVLHIVEHAGSGDVVIERDLDFIPPVLVVGRTVDAGGHAIPDCSTALFLGDPSRWSNAAVKGITSTNGIFRLTLRAKGSGTLLINDPRFHLRSMVLQLPDSGTLDVGDVALEPGCELAGIVKYANPSPLFPLAGLAVTASPTFLNEEGFSSDGILVDNQILRRRGDVVTRERISTVLDEAGRFRFRGLRRGNYMITAGLSLTGPRAKELCGGGGGSLVADAPSSDLVLEWSPSIIAASVRESGGIAQNVRVNFYFDPSTPHFGATTNSHGTCYFFTGDDISRVVVNVNARGYRHAALEVVPQRGRVVEAPLNLIPIEKPASLVLDVVGHDGLPIAEVSYALIPSGSTDARELWVRRAATESEGRLEITGLENGTYELEVRSGQWMAPDDYNAPAHASVLLDPGKTVVRKFKLELGGQLEVRTLDADSTQELNARCALRSSQGELVVSSFHFVGGRRPIAAPVLPAGTYAIEAECEGHESTKFPVTIEAGKRTIARLPMRRSR